MREAWRTLPWWCVGALVVAAVSTVGSIAFAIVGAQDSAASRGPAATTPAKEVVASDVPSIPVRWSEPASQGQQHGELFTSPLLAYDPASRRFRVPPAAEAPPAATETRLELLGVEVEAYPVRLTGHVGSGDALQGIFERTGSGEAIVAGTGHVFAGLGLAVERLDVRRASEGGRSEAFAVLRDALSGDQVELRSGQAPVPAAARARLRVVAKNRILEVNEGAGFETGGWAYRVLRVQGDPVQVVVVPERPGAPAVVWQELR